MVKQMNDVTISAMALSDLFFNHEHPEFDAEMKNADGSGPGTTDELMQAAILRDAQEFVRSYCPDQIHPRDLAYDFWGRL